MARDYLTLGSTPCGEDCAQLGSDEYHAKMSRETKAYIGQLERLFPSLPDGVYFGKKGFPHDFGTYHEVVIYFNPDDEDEASAACNVENNLPEYWDDTARLVLNPIREQLANDLGDIHTTYDKDNRLVRPQ